MRNAAICNYPSKLLKYLMAVAVCIVFANSIEGQPVLELTPVITSGLSSPIQFVNAGDGSNRIFIVQQGATIRTYDSAFNFLSVFLTVSNVNVGGERGLLSMAFHPDYKTNGLFYVYYTNTDGNIELARYHVSSDANLADTASKVILITIPHPTNANHNGGELHFGNDGYLYLSTGDGGGAGDVPNNAQNTAVLLGKMLRFNVNTSATTPYYTIPAGNPFNNEIFDLGLRNPFRWSFDRLTHDMWIGDVGQDSYEEIDYRAAGLSGGVNFGWHCYEGNATYNTSGCGPASDYVFPIFTYPTPNPSGAVTGGIVYRGTAYPALQGYNISADFFTGNYYKTVANGTGGWTTTMQNLSPTGTVDFGETENGEAYVVSLTANSVYRLGVTGVLPVSLENFSGTLDNSGVKLNWQTGMEQNLRRFEIEYSFNGASFLNAGYVTAKNAPAGSGYTFLHSINYDGTIFYRLKIINGDASSTYSDVIRITLHTKEKNIVAPSVIKDGMMNVDLAALAYNSLELISINGAVVLQRDVAGQTGQVIVPVGNMAAGIYIVRLAGNAKISYQKVFLQ